METGDILVASWGHEQTNVDFYRVEKLSGDFVTLVHLLPFETMKSPTAMAGYSTPSTTPDGKPFRRKVKQFSYGPCVTIKDYQWAYLWNGYHKQFTTYA